MKPLVTVRHLRATEAQIEMLGKETMKEIAISKAASIDEKLMELFPNEEQRFIICCGLGDTGTIGIALASLLHENLVDVSVCIVDTPYPAARPVTIQQRATFLNDLSIPYRIYNEASDLKIGNAIVIDAILDAYLNFEKGTHAYTLAQQINQYPCKVIAVEGPSGFQTDGPVTTDHFAIHADMALCFYQEDCSYFLPESYQFVKEFYVLETCNVEVFEDVSNPKVLPALYFKVLLSDVAEALLPRPRFSHKGTFGHALIIAGSDNTLGAALVSGENCLHAGAGLTTLCVPTSGVVAVNTRIPEVMTVSQDDLMLTNTAYTAIGIGPGLGVTAISAQLLQTVLTQFKGHAVLDADALNLLAQIPNFEQQLQPNWILTPHMKEFDRLFGKHDNWFERINTGSAFAVKNKLIVILKNQYTFILLPDGNRLINTTGNPAMASGGMGDALTGIIVSFLAQGLTPAQAAYAGCYMHGMTGDYLFASGEAVVTATDIAKKIPHMIYSLHH